MKKLWEGRFSKKTKKEVEDFTSSLDIDSFLAKYDLKGSIVYAEALERAGIINSQEKSLLVSSLKKILSEVESGKFKFKPSDEDIHTAMERRLVEICGGTGKKIHSGRSRNEQIVLDVKLYLKDVTRVLKRNLAQIVKILCERAIKEAKTLMPGYTHLQRAQIVTLGHHLNAHACAFLRHIKRLDDFEERNDELPLGSGALAGNSFRIDRKFLAEKLGFRKISLNSMDAVSSRDFVSEFIFVLTLIMLTLSRISEELILWSTEEFKFLELPDEFCTGSSLMPHKKNPDVPELIRARAGILMGMLISILSIEKNLPLSYNRDLQEDKRALLQSVELTLSSLNVMGELLKNVEFKRERMREDVKDWKFLMTDLAENLVRRKVPFRDAHREVGRLVNFCIKKNKSPMELSDEELSRVSKIIRREDLNVLSPERSVEAKNLPGGTAPGAVRKTARVLLRSVKKYLYQ